MECLLRVGTKADHIMIILQQTFIPMESTSCELALTPSLYNHNPIIHTIIISSGEQPSSALLQSRPGEPPTFRASHVSPRESTHIQSHPKSTPTSTTGFREPPYKPAWPQETPYTTVDVFPVVSVPFYPMYPARVHPIWASPYWNEVSRPRSGLWLIRCETCRNRLTIREFQFHVIRQFMT